MSKMLKTHIRAPLFPFFLESYPGSPLNEGGKGEKGRRENGKERRGEHGGRAGERRVREERGLKGKRKRGPQFSFLATPL